MNFKNENKGVDGVRMNEQLSLEFEKNIFYYTEYKAVQYFLKNTIII